MSKILIVLGLNYRQVAYNEVTREIEFQMYSALVRSGYSKVAGELGEQLFITKSGTDTTEVDKVLANPPKEDKYNVDYDKLVQDLNDKGWKIYKIDSIIEETITLKEI